MSLQLIIGRAGAGKSQFCLEAIAASLRQSPRCHHILIVPEQISFLSEKKLLKALGGTGGFYAKTLSFRRFAWTVLQETGPGLPVMLDQAAKSLILRRILETKKGQLTHYRKIYRQAGFVQEMISLLDELRGYQHEPEKLKDCLETLEEEMSFAQGKMKDISEIYEAYNEMLEDGWLDFPGVLNLLCEKLPQWSKLNQCYFWIDGFHSFSPGERQVLQTLMKLGRPIQMTLTMEPGQEGESLSAEALFYPTWKTWRQMKEICIKEGLALLPAHYLHQPDQKRFASNPGLAHLERLVAFPGRRQKFPLKTEALKVIGYANPQEEVEGLANQLLQAAQDQGLRYQEMVVLLRQPERYESLIRSVFSAYEIPYFMDHPQKLSYHPLFRGVLALVNLWPRNWDHEGLFLYIKSGYAGLSPSQGDVLENYCLAYGLGRRHWESDYPWQWSQTEADEKMERLRQKVWQPLKGHLEEIHQDLKVEKIMEILYEYIKGLPIAESDYQARDSLIMLLQQMTQYLGSEVMDLQELVLVLTEGLEAAEMSRIPPALDQVTISSMDRSRTPETARVWILGANEGILPAKYQEQGLLTDQERDWLKKQDFELAPSGQERLFSEQFLVYIALTRATRQLVLSFPRADIEGKALAPSSLLKRLLACFPKMEYQDQTLLPEVWLTHPGASIHRLSVALQDRYLPEDKAEIYRGLYAWYAQHPQWQRSLEKVHQGMGLQALTHPIPPALSKRLFGRQIKTSVTRLEAFQACPFAHFSAYGLGLKPRKTYQVKPPDVGNLIHDSLEELIRQCMGQGVPLSQLSSEVLAEKVEKVVQDQLQGSRHQLFQANARHRFLARNLNRVLLRAASILAEHDRQGSFMPAALEAPFGTDEPGSWPPLELKLSEEEKVILRGRIDRLDQAIHPTEGTRLLRIIDYKSGPKKLDLWEVYYGLNLQLVLYLDVACQALAQEEAVLPAGMFYFQVADPFIRLEKTVEEEALQTALLKKHRLKGFVLADPQVVQMMDQEIQGASRLLPVTMLQSGGFGAHSSLCSQEEFQQLQGHARRVVRQAAQAILEGQIQVSPYKAGKKTPCAYCDFGSVCRFDLSVEGNDYRLLSPMNKEEVFKNIVQGEQDDKKME